MKRCVACGRAVEDTSGIVEHSSCPWCGGGLREDLAGPLTLADAVQVVFSLDREAPYDGGAAWGYALDLCPGLPSAASDALRDAGEAGALALLREGGNPGAARRALLAAGWRPDDADELVGAYLSLWREPPKKDIGGASVSGLSESYPYTGRPIEPEPRVELGGRTLARGRDYRLSYRDNVGRPDAASRGSVEIEGIGEYQGTRRVTFGIAGARPEPKDIGRASVSGLEQSYPYTGRPIEPEPTVELGERVLVRGRDYQLVYHDNVGSKSGDSWGAIDIVGIGEYRGNQRVIFTIKAKPERKSWVVAVVVAVTVALVAAFLYSWMGERLDIGDASVHVLSTYTYTGNPIEPELRVELGGRTLEEGRDYQLSFRDNVGSKSGTSQGYIDIVGIGRYRGTKSVPFTIYGTSDEPDPYEGGTGDKSGSSSGDGEQEGEDEDDYVHGEPEFTRASCSSYREDSYNDVHYYAKYVLDNNENTAWNEGESGDGTGEWVRIEANGAQRVRGIDIRNGYQKINNKYPNGELFRYNNRPRDVTITLSDGYKKSVDLKDETGWQQVDFGGVHETTYVQITIDSVYPHEKEGEDWNDTCISDLHAYANEEYSYSDSESESLPAYGEPEFTRADCSSYRKDSYNDVHYYAKYVLDNNANTAWNEGESGDGTGEWVRIEANGAQRVRGIDIRNGYQKISAKYPNGELFRYNNRPRDVTITLSDGYEATVELYDVRGWQWVDFGEVHETTYVQITIDSVYSHEKEGEDWNDTCISDLHAYANTENSYR